MPINEKVIFNFGLKTDEIKKDKALKLIKKGLKLLGKVYEIRIIDGND